MDKLIEKIIAPFLPNNKTTVLFGGGFKPPTKGHFEIIKQVEKDIKNVKEIIIFVGSKERDGITQQESLDIWNIYTKYIDTPVKLVASHAPIKSIIDFSKDNPYDEITVIIGGRKDNEDDLKDIELRSKSLSKYPNLTIYPIITPLNKISGTLTRRAILNGDKVGFKSMIPNIINDEDVNKILGIVFEDENINELNNNEIKYWALFANIFDFLKKDPNTNYNKLKPRLKGESLNALKYFYNTYFIENELTLNENATYSSYINYKKHINELVEYYLQKYPHITYLPKVIFIDGDDENAKTIFTQTGYYSPTEKTIYIYTEGRHPRDIISTFSHEFIHFIQDLDGKLDNISTTITTEDDYLDNIEKEAYLEGNITFRNWKDSQK